MFVPGRLFQTSPMFVGKARSLPKGAVLKGAKLGWAPALQTDFILVGWKGPTREQECLSLAGFSRLVLCLWVKPRSLPKGAILKDAKLG